MNILLLSLWCCVLCIQLQDIVSIEVNIHNNSTNAQDDNGEPLSFYEISVNASQIKMMMKKRWISKIHIYVVDTFYVDDDLILKGIKELQILANKWHVSREATFDLSALESAQQAEHEPLTVKGAPGHHGYVGMNGGNFFGLAFDIINGDLLTVKSNGGNGGDGQDGTRSDDILNVFDDRSKDSNSGWFSSARLHSYYESYFRDRGYLPNIFKINDSTTLYAVFVHNKEYYFNAELHPSKCCGTTGVGGLGGLGGQGGTFRFKNFGSNNSDGSAKFVGKDGLIGINGRDGEVCRTFGLNVTIHIKLKKVVFLFLPIHYSFSSEFSIVDRFDSSNCIPEFVPNGETPNKQTKRNSIEVVPAIINYKSFLLSNIKMASQWDIIRKSYEAIDGDSIINSDYTVNSLVDEASELESQYLSIKSLVDVLPLYEGILKRIQSKNTSTELFILGSIVRSKLTKLKSYREIEIIGDLRKYCQLVIQSFDFHFNEDYREIDNVQLRNKIHRLRDKVNAQNILDEYNQIISAFKLNFFPFAALYLEKYELPSPLTDRSAILTTVKEKLNLMLTHINDIANKDRFFVQDFYFWENSQIREKIEKLFAGEKITLFADINQSASTFNAIKFNTVNFIFRSSNSTINDKLDDVLKNFGIELKHSGKSAFRCNRNIYEVTGNSVNFMFSYHEDNGRVKIWAGNYKELLDNQPILSPFTSWEIQLIVSPDSRYSKIFFNKLKDFIDSVDVEMIFTGEYIKEGSEICSSNNFYDIVRRSYKVV